MGVAVFDVSASEAFVTKDLPAATGYSITFEIFIAQSVIAATYANGGNVAPNLLEMSGSADGLAIVPDPDASQYAFQSYFGSAAGALPAGSWFPVQVDLVFSSGTSWDSTITANGTVFADGTQDFGVNSSAPFPFDLGAKYASATPGGVIYARNFVAKDLSAATVFSDDFSGTLGGWTSTTGAASIGAGPITGGGVVGGGVRIAIAFDNDGTNGTFVPSPTWTYLTDTDNLVASYDIHRGRAFEFDRTDTGTANIRINDVHGVLDPTNSTGPYYTKIEPLLQIQIELWNPVDLSYSSRFRGFIEEFNYSQDPSQLVMFLEIQCVGIMAMLTAIEMQPDGTFGETPVEPGTIFFGAEDFQSRIENVLGNAGIDTAFSIVFTGNILMPDSPYSPGQNVLEVIEEAADAEFPTVANIYENRLGQLCAHGRLAMFDPFGTAAGATPGAWDICGGLGVPWKVGDGAAVLASISDTAQLRTFAFNRGMSKVFNQAFCTPWKFDPAIDDPADQTSTDATSIGKYGIRSWSAENLKVYQGTTTMNDAKDECKLYADYIKNNYAQPHNRITEMSFKSLDPSDPRAPALWTFLTLCDVMDPLDVTVTDPGGVANFNAEPGFIQGITETVEPLNGEYALVTLDIDWSPASLFNQNPFS